MTDKTPPLWVEVLRHDKLVRSGLVTGGGITRAQEPDFPDPWPERYLADNSVWLTTFAYDGCKPVTYSSADGYTFVIRTAVDVEKTDIEKAYAKATQDVIEAARQADDEHSHDTWFDLVRALNTLIATADALDGR